MTEETKAERSRRLARERQAARRARTARHREAMQAETLKMEIYGGTRADIDLMRTAAECSEAEVLTLGIHYLGRMARLDPAGFVSALDPRNLQR
ncbi:hypothetical protein [Pseudomonas sp. PS02288]|uniref:hypothetical protein n=1 Tax=Pseudomonas sp. PS02288 TaxID=2991443 RepID=UPI00249CB73A|nr:hypothetical protein [Pseudomonas sp. PS02288]